MRYTFEAVERCNMCGSPSSTHKILGRRLNSSHGRNPKRKQGITTTVCKCRSCGLIYSNPQPIPVSLQDHYGVPPEKYWKDDYFKINEHAFDHDIARLRELISFDEQMKFLDVGAGLGKQMLVYEKQGFESYGFEPSQPFYDRAINKMGVSSERLKCAMIEEVEYDSDFFDYISFGVVLEHLYHPSESLEKALKWLKPNGVIHIEVPSADWLVSKMVNLYYKLILTDYVSNISPMHAPYHLYEFTLRSFELNGGSHGYEVAHFDRYVCDTYMPKILDFPLKKAMKATGTGMQLSVWLRKSVSGTV